MGTKGVLLAITLLSLVLASGCLTSEPIDCGSDESCFADALSSCKAAIIKTESKEEAFGVIDLRYKLSASIKGAEGDSCIVEETFEEMEMIGNLTQAPSRLIFYMYSLTGSPITCKVSGPIDLDIGGINNTADECSGDALDILKEALKYKGGEPPQPASIIEVEEAFCVGGERIVIYVRNEGSSDINLSTDMHLLDSDGGEPTPVEWMDFSGSQTIEMLYPLKMAQAWIKNVSVGTLYEYEISLGEDSYPFYVQC